MTYWFTFAKTGQKENVPPNLHMLKDHAADFIGTWSSPGHGVYGEQGAESIHKILRLLQRAYCSMQPATIHLQSMLKKNIRAKTSSPRCKGFEACNSSEKVTSSKGRKFSVTIKIFL